MSNPESFIDEVTEEVRRDRLFAIFRKYGWIGVLIVLGVVGGTAYNEWSKSKEAARAQAFGDAVLEAMDVGGAATRRDALSSVTNDGGQKAIVDLLLASDPAENRVETLAALSSLAADVSQPQTYRDLATLRHTIISGADLPVADRRTALDPIAAPGRPFRPLALEQLAYLLIEEGKTADAIAALRSLTQDQEAPAGLRRRAEQVIVALGGTVDTVADAG